MAGQAVRRSWIEGVRAPGRMKVLGIMSGTSADGVDAALVDIRERGGSLKVRSLAGLTLPYPRSLRQHILGVATNGTVPEVCRLNVALGEVFAKAALRLLRRARLKPTAVRLIGSHGQTVRHLPDPVRAPGVGFIRSTLQLGEPAVIAERTGILTVANFRPRDMAVGGQGAPLTAYVHYLLLRHARRSRFIVNLGGISNATYVPARAVLRDLRAFDTGPGNMVLDGLVREATRGRLALDRDGMLAASGRVNRKLLARLLAHPFLKKRPPKSTGREDFGARFLARLLAEARRSRATLPDILATCSVFTAQSIARATRWLDGAIDEVIVGGGGVYNRTLMAHLTQAFDPVPVKTFEDFGWDSKRFEAMAFAVLAYETYQGRCGNAPAATGASKPVVLGALVPGSRSRGRRRSPTPLR